jgi:hypothetical protein
VRWKTPEVKDIIEKALAAEGFKTSLKITVNESGGDHDSDGILVKWENDSLYICGFHCTKTSYDPGNTPEDMEIEMIEVSDGKDSRGGLNSADPDVCKGYGVICGALRLAGFSVCPCMKDYF